jgi:hypothetical protein
MTEVANTAIVVGAILFALGLFPGLLPVLIARFQGLRDYFFPSRGRIKKFQSGLPLHTDAWLLGGGGVIMILGLLALLC